MDVDPSEGWACSFAFLTGGFKPPQCHTAKTSTTAENEVETPTRVLIERIYPCFWTTMHHRPRTYSQFWSMHISLGCERITNSHQVTLEPSSYTEEKYELFELYQTKIHNDSSSPGGFKRFLVDSPLKVKQFHTLDDQLPTLPGRANTVPFPTTRPSSDQLWLLSSDVSPGR